MFLSGSDNSSEFIGDDSNAVYETFQPEKLGDHHAPSDGSGGNSSSSNSNSNAGAVPGSSSTSSAIAGAIGAGGALGGAGGMADSTALRPQNHHKDLITRVIQLDRPYLYVTASKDGSVRTWNGNTMQFKA
ncbi:hypothetical protein PINS_up023510 [Pythium insidiosum]|nr:hypothetical protein PINS_up023510 [Pythium insidiosum]